MPILRAAAVYFALVFAAGFLLGVVRMSALVPCLGSRAAELVELPVMVGVCAFVARWRQARTPDLSPERQLAVGWLALAMLLAAECALGAVLQGRAPDEVWFERDPVAGTAYGAALVLFALFPWVFARRAAAARARGR